MKSDDCRGSAEYGNQPYFIFAQFIGALLQKKHDQFYDLIDKK